MYLPFAIVHLRPFLSQNFAVRSSIITYANVSTVSATSQGQFCLLSYSDVKKAKGNGLLNLHWLDLISLQISVI